MVRVVEADGDDLADAAHGGAEAGGPADRRQVVGLQPPQSLQARGRQRRGVNVVDVVAEIAELAGSVDEAGLLPAGPAVADEFHAGLPKCTVLSSAAARYDGLTGIRKGATAAQASCTRPDRLPIFACSGRLGRVTAKRVATLARPCRHDCRKRCGPLPLPDRADAPPLLA